MGYSRASIGKLTALGRLPNLLLAVGLAMGATVLTTPGAQAQGGSNVTLAKSASVTSVAPGTPFTYALKYSCSSLTTTC